jgi:endonuclease G, mitochondrial
MAKFQVDNVRADPELRRELEQRWRDDAARPVRRAIVLRPGETTPGVVFREPSADHRRRVAAPTMDELLAENLGTEAIILRFGRPSLLVQRDTFDVPASDTWKARLDPTRSKLETAIRSVGRVEVPTIGVPYIGTAWIIAPGIAVTNRHVADVFALRGPNDEFAFRLTPEGQPYAADLDFHEEAGRETPFEVDLDRILFISEDRQGAPDVALVGVKPRGRRPLPPPIPLFDGAPGVRQTVAAIGYPAADPRDDASDEARIFGNVFNVKRLAPGEVTSLLDNGAVFTHDCTTLGGNSGSAIVDVETGAALGLHFAGIYLKNNYALAASELKKLVDRLGGPTAVTTVASTSGATPQERVVKAASLAGRAGYDPQFLGPAAGQLVPLPSLTAALETKALAVNGAGAGLAKHLLPYEHFSIVMHGDRKMAIFTAVNIDGAQEQRLKRTVDPWAKDPRIAANAQIGAELYTNNQLDRGHLVRRLDPTWGPDAKTAELDSFFFTNCTPQHANFNQVLWAELEDYLLDNAGTLGFRACVFTGPVFGDTDGLYRGVRLPNAYWKVATMLRTEDGKLSATGYMVSQADLITNLEFAYGAVRTYQVSLARIESLTGLDFGALRDADPLKGQEGVDVRELATGADIRL